MIVDDDANCRAVLCDVLAGEPYILLERDSRGTKEGLKRAGAYVG
jgi:hypothetical protein